MLLLCLGYQSSSVKEYYSNYFLDYYYDSVMDSDTTFVVDNEKRFRKAFD